MKMVLAGLGSFGYTWYQLLKEQYPELQIVVVEADEAKRALIHEEDSFYCSLEEAIKQEHPIFMLNATPPSVHTALNHTAFDYKLPVLCEKPIADSYESAQQIVMRAKSEQIPFMIAENYRWFPIVRRAREVIVSGILGKITSARIDFYRNQQSDRPYFLSMDNPLLEDIAVHHFDMLRYLFGCEGVRVFAQCTNPAGSGYSVNVGLHAVIELEHSMMATYSGCFGTRGTQTPWHGSWRIEGTEGMLLLADQLIYIQGEVIETIDFSEIKIKNCLDEFMAAINDNRVPEASGEDYLRTQAIVHFALESHRSGCMMEFISRV